MNKTTTKWASSKQVCEHLQIGRATLTRWIAEGLPAHRAVPGAGLRFDLDEVDAWLRSRWFDPESGQGVA